VVIRRRSRRQRWWTTTSSVNAYGALPRINRLSRRLIILWILHNTDRVFSLRRAATAMLAAARYSQINTELYYNIQNYKVRCIIWSFHELMSFRNDFLTPKINRIPTVVGSLEITALPKSCEIWRLVSVIPTLPPMKWCGAGGAASDLPSFQWIVNITIQIKRTSAALVCGWKRIIYLLLKTKYEYSEIQYL